MAKLRDLNPRLSRGVSVGPGAWCLSFQCPKCGPGYEVAIYMHSGPAANGVWQFKPADLFPAVDTSWMDNLTVEPSIGEPSHGRKKCTWHGTIAKGEVAP